MDFLYAFETDVEHFSKRFNYFEVPMPNEHIVDILRTIDITDNVKQAILSIDTAMRLADTVDDSNKETRVLSTDLLSALFYSYISKHYQSDIFYILTEAVKQQNIWKTKVSPENIELIKKIETAFVAPFLKNDDCEYYINQLIDQSYYKIL